jgi:hypothetical protein
MVIVFVAPIWLALLACLPNIVPGVPIICLGHRSSSSMRTKR